MVEIDELDKLTEGMGRLDGPRAGLDEFDELLSLEAQWNEVLDIVIVIFHCKLNTCASDTLFVQHVHTQRGR
jgi:hypothetical protein